MVWFDLDFVWRLAFSTSLFAVGGICLKAYADSQSVFYLVLSLLIYALGTYFFADILRHGLGFGMVMASMIDLALMVLIGVLFFEEPLEPTHYAGLAFAACAMVLFSRPATST